MRKDEADETLDHLHEILDERFEAGPAPYIVSRATAESIGPDDWAVEVVYQPSADAPLHGLRRNRLDGEPSRTPLQLAWALYHRLESGPADPARTAAVDGIAWATD